MKVRNVVTVAAGTVAAGLFVGLAQYAPQAQASQLGGTVAVAAQTGAVRLAHRGLWVERAPRGVCRDALKVDVCWRYTGTRSQVVFDRAGFAVTS